MNFFQRITEALGTFARRNPLLALFIILACLITPVGAASVFLSVLAALILLFVLVTLFLGYKLRKMQKQMRARFENQAHTGRYGQQGASWSEASAEPSAEPEMKIYKTADTPAKKVSEKVGDYIEFEETKDR